MSFKTLDFVYHNSRNDIGKLTDVPTKEWPSRSYRVQYCQGKQLSSTEPDGFISGGNGPIFETGYPKLVTELEDVLFIHAVREQFLRNAAVRLLERTDKKIAALKLSREVVIGHKEFLKKKEDEVKA